MATDPVQVNCRLYSLHSEKYETTDTGYDCTDVGKSIKLPELPPFELKPDKKKAAAVDKFYYGVRIVTGFQGGAGTTDSTVYIELIGATTTSGVIQISNTKGFFKHRFCSCAINDCIIEADSELEIDVFKLGLTLPKGFIPKRIHNYNMYAEFMQVYDLQKVHDSLIFPCHQWIETEVTCTSKTTTVKDASSNPALMKQRTDQLDQRVKTYTWQSHPNAGYPSSIDDTGDDNQLPINEEFSRAKNQNFLGNIFTGAISGGLSAVHAQLSQRFDEVLGVAVSTNDSALSLDKFEEFAIKIRSVNEDSPSISSDLIVYEAYRWVSDVEFGRQILNGVNPVIIKRCNSLPDHFPVTDEMMKGIVSATKSLSEEMKDGRIYICDLSEVMDGLKCRQDYYCPAPTCLLRVNNAGQLVPIAIQLKRQPVSDDDENPIFIPTDNWMDWLLAKIYYHSAHSQFHQLSTHYIACHATMEAYGMAVMRTLPDAHPIYKLLQRHFRYTMSINSAARRTLISQGGIIDHLFAIGGDGKVELVRRANSLYRVQGTHIKKCLKERGVDDPNLLPGYYYRDDGIKLWNAIEEYVSDIINIFYSSDDDVKEDPELSNWVHETHTTAFPAYGDAPLGRGFPAVIDTKVDLIDYCTLIIFTGSVQHAAINFGQFDMYGYIPNAPPGVRKPPPKRKGQVNYAHLLNSLPSTFDAVLSTTIISSLSQYSPDEIYLGGYPSHWFTELKAQDAEKKFLNALEKLEIEFSTRNEKLDIPYTYMLPSLIPNSITI